MKDEDKTKEQLINELKQLRQRATEWEKSETEHKQLQEALQESEQWHRLLVETMSDGLAVMDKNMLIIFVNDKFSEMLGYNRQELIGRRGIDLHDEANQIILKEELAKRRQGKHGAYEITFSRKDGQRVSALVSPKPLLDAEGHFKGSFAVVTDITELKHKEAELAKHRQHLEKLVEDHTAQLTRANKQLQRDITERKRTEEVLRESEKRFRQLAESIREVFYLNDPDKTQMIYVSPAYEEIWGRTCESLYERPMSFLEAVHPEDRERIITTFERQRRGETIEVEYRILRPDGSSRWICSRAFPVWNERGKLDRIAGIAEDITERKEVEEALRRREQELQVVADNVPGLLSYVNADGCYRFVNKRYQEWFGLRRTEIIGKHYREVLGKSTYELIKDYVAGVLSGQRVSYEHALPYMHGGTRWVAAEYVPDADDEGKVRGFFALVTDITGRKQMEEELRKSETRYREFVDFLPQSVFEIDERGYFTFANRHGLDSTGYTQDDIEKGLNALQLFVLEDRDRVERNIQRILGGEKLSPHEYTALSKDGSTFPVIIYSAPIIRDNKPVGLRGVVIDITELKRTEEKLRESEKRYRFLADNAGDAIWTVDLNKRLTYASPSITRLLSYSVEEAMAMAPEKVFTPRSLQLAMKTLAEELAIENMEQKDMARSRVLELELKRKDGSKVPVEAKYTFLRDPHGRPVEVLAVVRDITERKKAEEVLKESEEKFRNLAEQSPNMIFINKKGKVVYANEKCEEMMGYKREEFYSEDFDFLTLIAPETRHLIEASFRKHLKGEEIAPYEETLITKEGRRIEAIAATKLISYGGETAILGTVTNITERKRMEEALRKRETELELQAIELEEANIALRVLLKQREDDRAELEERILSNVKQLVVPCIERLKTTRLDAKQIAYLSILESRLNDLISPFVHKLSSTYYNLTFREVEVVNLVKDGKTNKEIAELLNITPRTVKFHRDNLRKKLGIRNTKTNLRSHLFSFH